MDSRRTSSRARRQACKGEVAGVCDAPMPTQKRSRSVRQAVVARVRLLADPSWTWRELGAGSSRSGCDRRCKGSETEWLGNWGRNFRSSQRNCLESLPAKYGPSKQDSHPSRRINAGCCELSGVTLGGGRKGTSGSTVQAPGPANSSNQHQCAGTKPASPVLLRMQLHHQGLQVRPDAWKD